LYVRHRKFDGEMMLFYLGGYGIGRFFIEQLRTDQLRLPGTRIAVSQFLGLFVFVCSVLADLYLRRKKKSEYSVKS
ncbi:MAG: prolipoprotein diacylglyceryl transferase, partial [Lachnospiraceae bacterium]|nr:prolipoprotein diacylglyceryl transferase [Lachnospiraceae bacterium]